MEIQLRIVMLVIGLLILLGVAIDLFRRRPFRETASAANNNANNNDLLSAISGAKHHHSHQASLSNSPAYQYDDIIHHGSNIEPEIEMDEDIVYKQPILIDDLEGIEEFADYVEPEAIERQYSVETFESEAEPEAQVNPSDVIAIFIMARDPAGFDGDELYTALSNANFYLGKNDVFYRYSNDDGTGEHLFTLVKAVEPGYFNVHNLRNELVPGITLLMLPSQLSSPLAALDKLVRAAKQIAFVLNGELLDSSRQPLTLTTIDGYREQIQAT